MARMNVRRKRQLSENETAAIKWMKFGAFAIALGVVVYSEYMFLSILSIAFNNAGFGGLAIVGAVATGASILLLIAAKLKWITPGSQEIASWIFTGIEVAVLVLNDMLGYWLHKGPVTGILGYWQLLTPGSPVIALVGWLFILFFDPAQREAHADMDLEAKKAKSERAYLLAAHDAEMELRENHLNQVTARLQDVIASDRIQQQIVDHAVRMVDRVLTDVSGIVASGSLPLPAPQEPRQIAPPAQVSFAQEATIEHPLQPDVQPGIVQKILNVFKPVENASSTPLQPCALCGGNAASGRVIRSGVYICPTCLAELDGDEEDDTKK